MHRRRYLVTLAATGSAMMAGCGSLLGSGAGDPAETAEAFFQAINSGDIERANELLHDEHGSIEDQWPEDVLEEREKREYTIEETRTAEESGDEATVELTYSAVGTSDEGVFSVELRAVDGEWRVWQTQMGG